MSSCYKHALEHESFSRVFMNPLVCYVNLDFWVGQLSIDQKLAVFSGLNLMFDVHICIFKNKGVDNH